MIKQENSQGGRVQFDPAEEAYPEREAGGLDSRAMRRVVAAEQDARNAAKRDRRAQSRDVAAAARDRAAQRRERRMEKMEASLAGEDVPAETVLEYAKQLRQKSTADREKAAEDRRKAAADRERAAREREAALGALHGAHFDDLTGTYRRGLGKDVLRSEIERARRSHGSLVLGIIDVDGLKKVNDTKGHLVGDQLLRDMVACIRANIRAYEPIVRLGGDEFAFTIAGLARRGAEERCALIRADLARRPSRGTFSVGLAVLEPDDELGDLLRRADAELVEVRPTRMPSRPSRVSRRRR